MANYIVDYKVNVTGNIDLAAKSAASINKNMKEAAAVGAGVTRATRAALNSTEIGMAGGGRGENTEYGAARGSLKATGASARDFAKQAEGLGGLVRLYATFAANIFAASMAFEAFKRSFAFEQLQQASDAFAVTTGKNLSGVAAELKKLADGALTDKAAQQMANYGSSAGFTADQMRRTIVVARGASQALGRDMGDAVDRLMRGMGKLEPELLDELGLLTRTKAAATEYAKSVGKTFETLTQFEKTQAFANAVLKEGEEKFGAVAKAVQISPFEKFSTALLNVGTMMANVVNKGLVPLLQFFSNNPGALIAALGLAFAKLLTTALPVLTKLGDAAKESAEEQKKAFEAIKTKATEAQGGILASERNRIKDAIKLRREESLDLKESILKDIKVRDQLLNDAAASQAKFVKQLRANSGASIPLEDLQKTANRAAGMIASGTNVEANTKLLELAKQQAKIELERINIQEQRTGLVKEEIELRNKLRSMVSAADVPVSKGFASQQASAALSSFKADQLAAVTSTAQVYGMRKAFVQLGETISAVGAKHRELYEGIYKRDISATISRSFAQASTAISGMFGIMTAGVSSFLAVAGPWIAVIGLAIAAFEVLKATTGGVNENLTRLEETQDTFAKALKLTGEQAVRFTQLQLAVDGTAESFLKLKTYSANVFTGIVDGLETTTSAFAAFVNNSDGWWSKITEGIAGIFGKDSVTKQIEQLRSSIYTTLATTSAEDKQKVQSAILQAMPSAQSIDDVVAKLGSLSNVQLADFGVKLSSNLANVNIQLKASEDNLKNAIGGWKSLGEAIDKYNDKNEVKDPKLKGVVDALDVINAAYRSATTEKDKALALSKVDTDLQDKLVKLMKERGLATQELVKWLEEARASSMKYAEQEKQSAIDRQNSDKINALNFINNQNAFIEKQKELAEIQRRLKEDKYTGTESQVVSQRNEDQQRAAALGEQLKTSLSEAQTLAKEAHKEIEAVILGQFKSELELNQKTFWDSIKSGLTYGKSILAAEAQKASNSATILAGLDTREYYPGTKIPLPPESAARGAPTAPLPTGKTPLETGRAGLAVSEAAGRAQEKTTKDFEYRIKLAGAYVAEQERINQLEKETSGFISQSNLDASESLKTWVAQENYAKSMRDIEVENDKLRKNPAYKPEEVKKIKQDEEALVKRIFETTKSTIEQDRIREGIVNRISQAEKQYFQFVKEAADIASSVLDARIKSLSISDAQAETEKLNLDYAKFAVSYAKERFDLTEKGQTAEVALLDLKKEAVDQQLIINKLMVDYKNTVNDAARTEQLITDNLALQATALNVTSTEAERVDQVRRSSQAAIIQAAAQYIEIERNLTDEKDKQIALSNAVLQVENKILETKRAAYEANTRDPRADIGKTIQQGLNIAFEDAQRKAIGYSKSLVDGITNGINDAVDLFFTKIASGTKMTFKEISTAFSTAFKKAIFEGFASQVKKMFAGLFADGGESDAIQLKNKIQEQIDAQKLQLSKVDQNIKALEALTNAVNNLARISSIEQRKVLADRDEIDKNFALLAESSKSASDNLLGVYSSAGDAETELANYTAGIMAATDPVLSLGSASVVASEALSTIPGILGSLASAMGISSNSPIGKAVNGISKLFSSGSKLFNGAEKIGTMLSNSAAASTSTYLPAAYAQFGAAGGEAAAVAAEQAVTSFAGSLGGATTAIAEFIPAIGIGVAAFMAYKTFFDKKGGPKAGGYGSSGTFPDQGNDFAKRSGGNDELDAAAKKGADEALSAYTTLIAKFGGKSGGAGFRNAVSTDPKGTSGTLLYQQAFVGGKKVYDASPNGPNADGLNVGRLKPEELAKRVGLETKRALFAALKASDLPKNVSDYFGKVADSAINNLAEADIDTKLDFGSVLGEISKNRSKIANTFGEDLYNLAEEDLKAFQVGSDTLSQTFDKLKTLFTSTDRIVKLLGISTKTAFGAVGLASTKARQSMVDAAGGIEEFTTKMTYFVDNFFSDADKASSTFADSVDRLQSGFKGLGADIPRSMSEYKEAISEALVDSNYTLMNSLLDLAPAFNEVIGAIDNVTKSINEMVTKSIDDILESTMTVGEKYTKYSEKANTGVKSVDKLSGMTDAELLDEIKAGRLTPDVISKMATDVINNANTAIGFIPTEERAAYQSQWVSFLSDFGKNVESFNNRISGLITGSGISIDSGLAASGLAASAAPGGLDIQSISTTMAATLETIANNSTVTQQAIFDQQVAALSALADKLLGAAEGMQAASVGQQLAANTPKEVNVAVTVNTQDGVTADVEVNR